MKAVYNLLITFIILVVLLTCSGCGASFHLKRAKYHITKAEALGVSIEVKSDTIVQFKDVPFPVVKFDTVFSVSKDTVTFTKDSIQYKVLFRNNKIYIHAQSKPRYFRVKETLYINRTTNIKAGKTQFEYWSFGIGFLIFGVVLGALFGRLLWR